MKLIKVVTLCLFSLISLISQLSHADNSGYLDCYRSEPVIGDKYGDQRTGFAVINKANKFISAYPGTLQFRRDDNVGDESLDPKVPNDGFLFINATFERAKDGSFFVEDQQSRVLHRILQFETKREAQEFCDGLIAMCLNSNYSVKSGKVSPYGDAGKYIGVRMTKWRPHYWGISVKYKAGVTTSTTNAPQNRNYNNYDDDDDDDDNSQRRPVVNPTTTTTANQYEALRCLTSP